MLSRTLGPAKQKSGFDITADDSLGLVGSMLERGTTLLSPVLMDGDNSHRGPSLEGFQSFLLCMKICGPEELCSNELRTACSRIVGLIPRMQ